MSIENAYDILYGSVLIFLALALLFALIRAVLGPTIADRVVSVNMAGTMTVMAIAVLSVYLDESFLGDVCLIYALISFIAVVVLSRVYLDGKRGGGR